MNGATQTARDATLGIGPADLDQLHKVLLIIGAMLLTALTSGLLFKATVESSNPIPQPVRTTAGPSPGFWIGKCENIIVIMLVVLGEFSALGLVFAAKGIAQQRNITRAPAYYLGGTLVNFVYSMFVGLAVRATIVGI